MPSDLDGVKGDVAKLRKDFDGLYEVLRKHLSDEQKARDGADHGGDNAAGTGD